MTIIRTVTEVTARLWEDWEVEPIPAERDDELMRNHLALFDYATTHGGQGWQGSSKMPVRVAMEIEDEETTTIEDAYVLSALPDRTSLTNRLEPPLAYVARGALTEAIQALPEDGANKSRDAGRGYAQAIHDVLELVKGLT